MATRKKVESVFNADSDETPVKARRQRKPLEDRLKRVSNDKLLKRHADLQAALYAVKTEAKRRIEDSGGALREIAG